MSIDTDTLNKALEIVSEIGKLKADCAQYKLRAERAEKQFDSLMNMVIKPKKEQEPDESVKAPELEGR